MGMSVKKLDGQQLHVLKHALAKLEHGALSHINHQAAVQIGTQGSKGKHNAQLDQSLGERTEVGVRLTNHWRDIVVDERSGE